MMRIKEGILFVSCFIFEDPSRNCEAEYEYVKQHIVQKLPPKILFTKILVL